MSDDAIIALSSATAAGQEARASLAVQLARSFRRSPSTFDPRLLERLGPTGLKRFLVEARHTAGEADLATGSLGHAPTQEPDSRRRSGWADLRTAEFSPWCLGVWSAVVTGSAIVGTGGLVLAVAKLATRIGGTSA
jgi:hypothetical protein